MCTSAILGKTTSWSLVAITAGHCIKDGPLTKVWSHNGTAWGRGEAYIYPNSGGAAQVDAGIIDLSTESGARISSMVRIPTT